MIEDNIRYQFRLNRARRLRLHELARASSLSPSLMAKTLCEMALDKDGFDPQAFEHDLLVIRAGIEQLFARSDREDELAAAIERAVEHRGVQVRTSGYGSGNGGGR